MYKNYTKLYELWDYNIQFTDEKTGAHGDYVMFLVPGL